MNPQLLPDTQHRKAFDKFAWKVESLITAAPSEARAQHDAELRAKLEALEKQEPVAVYRDEGGGFNAIKARKNAPFDSTWKPLYAKPVPATPAIPEGWQLVPKEPTIDMHDKGTQVILAFGEHPTCHGANECYKAMLSAAPKPATNEGE